MVAWTPILNLRSQHLATRDGALTAEPSGQEEALLLSRLRGGVETEAERQ